MRRTFTIAGGLIITPSMTQGEMDELSAAIKTLVGDMIKQDASDSTRQGFAQFAVGWNNYKAENSGWLDRGSSGIYAKVQEFRSRYNNWRDTFIKEGKTTSAPKLKVEQSLFEETAKAAVATVKELPDVVKQAPGMVKWIGLGLLGVGGVAMAYYLMRGK